MIAFLRLKRMQTQLGNTRMHHVWRHFKKWRFTHASGCLWGKKKKQCGTFKISAECNTSVRITDDIPLLNWIPHFKMKMRTGCSGKRSIAEYGEEELISVVKRMIQRMFVCHHDRTRTISYITDSGTVRGKKSDKTNLEWPLGIDEMGRFVWQPFACDRRNWRTSSLRTEKERIFYCQERWSRNLWKLRTENSTSCMRILELADTWEVVWDTRCLLQWKSDKTT